MKILSKEEEREREEEGRFGSQMDILKHVSDIKLRLKEDITSDFVLARLGTKDREAIIEMTANAYYAKKLLDIMRRRGTTWKWNSEKEEYIETKLTEGQKGDIKKIGEKIFDSYMTRIFMTVVLNRNVDRNYLINVLSGYKDDDEEGTRLRQEELKGAVTELLGDQSKKGVE